MTFMDNNIPPKEIAEEEMIDQAFQQLLHDYLATKHRKRVEIITKRSILPIKRTKVSNDVPVSLISCTLLL